VLLFAVYAFVFIAVFDSRFGNSPHESRSDYAIGLFLGLSLLQMFQESMLLAPFAIVQNPNYVKKVVFPLEVLPIAPVFAAAFRCAVSLSLVLLATVLFGPGFSWQLFWLLPLLLSLMLLSAGVSFFLSALGVFLRDIGPLVQFLSVLLMFVSAVFYSFAQVPAAFAFLRFNPLLLIVEMGRGAVLWQTAPNIGELAYTLGSGAVLFVVGQTVFSSLRGAFSDVL
jgi:lipopolysaccharide transport system permease protein